MRSGRKTAAKMGYSRRYFSTAASPPFFKNGIALGGGNRVSITASPFYHRPKHRTTALTRHRRRHRVVVLRAQRVVDLDFLRELLDGQPGQAPAAELLRRRRVHFRVAGGRQDLLADVQHTAGYVQVVVRDQVAAHLARPPDALLERRTCNQSGRGQVTSGLRVRPGIGPRRFVRPDPVRTKALATDVSRLDAGVRDARPARLGNVRADPD